jgi:hypothetical protein
MQNIIAMCEKRISDYDQHMADTYDLPSAVNEIILRAERAEAEAEQLRQERDELLTKLEVYIYTLNYGGDRYQADLRIIAKEISELIK